MQFRSMTCAVGWRNGNVLEKPIKRNKIIMSHSYAIENNDLWCWFMEEQQCWGSLLRKKTNLKPSPLL